MPVRRYKEPEKANDMDIDLNAIEVTDNPDEQRYEAKVGHEVAAVYYQREGNQIIFTHTEVPAALEGHGLAAKMARFALDDARSRGLVVIPLCPYVASFIRRHQEYADLVSASFRARIAEE